MLPGWCCIANRHIGARERRQLIPHVRFQVPFLGPESQLKSGFACAGLLCSVTFFPEKLEDETQLRHVNASLELQCRETMEIRTKTLQGRLRGRPVGGNCGKKSFSDETM